MSTKLRLLLIEDDELDAALLKAELEEAGFDCECRRVLNGEELQQALLESTPDIVVSDFMLPSFNGLEALRLVRQRDQDVPFIIVSGRIGEDVAVEAMRAGANDYVMKTSLARLGPAIRRELEAAREHQARKRAEAAQLHQSLLAKALRDTAAVLSSTLELDDVLDSILGNVEQVIPHDAAGIVFVEGETARVVRYRVADDHHGERPMLNRRLDQPEMTVLDRMTVSGKPFVVKDVSRQGQWRRVLVDLPWVRSLAAAPILQEEQLFGYLILLSAEAEQFKPAHAALLEGFALHAATAIRNARLFASVSRNRSELRRLSTQMLHAQEQERKRISRELHDEVGQALTAIVLNADFLRAHHGGEMSQQMTQRLDEISSLARQTMEQIRSLSRLLRPSMLDDLGLVPTLRWFTDAFSKRTGLAVELVITGIAEQERLDADIETVLFRVVQEAMTNVAKHAQASSIRLTLARDDQHLALEVEDDGTGFAVDEALHRESADRGIGLVGMRERVSQLQGRMHLEASPGKGTRLEVWLPQDQEAATT